MSVVRDRDIECPLYFKLQEFFRRELKIPDETSEANARKFMRDYWLSDVVHVVPMQRRVDTI